MIKIQNRLAIEHKGAATKLFLDAFGSKFFPILGKGEKTQNLIESSINSYQCISALENGKLVGILAIQYGNESFIDISFSELKAVYGPVKGLVKLALLSLFDYQPIEKEIHIECISVDGSSRGKGIGTKLLDELFSRSEKDGAHKVTLEVVDSNPKAIALYKKIGFVVEKHSKIWPINKIVGWSFNNVIKMYKSIG
ncbi:MAG: GNAT family N-acetyltransferase [Proteobacteria bacterium]|nr:GNAT family N-acetyltransferase [Pseudomonadota bacterium]